MSSEDSVNLSTPAFYLTYNDSFFYINTAENITKNMMIVCIASNRQTRKLELEIT